MESRKVNMSTILIIIAAFLLALVFWLFYLGRPAPIIDQVYGVSFSSKQARALQLNSEEAYLAILDDLEVKSVRLAAYWDIIETSPGQFDFSELDWQIDEAGRRNVTALLAVGRKLPRWPECFMPDWARDLAPPQQNKHLLQMLRVVIERYRHREAVVAWQLENEPFVGWFGQCPKLDRTLLQEELNLVRSLSPKPVVITDSGELSTWRRTARFADRFGTTMYRVTWNPYYGYGFYPLPASLYRLKARLWGLNPSDVSITELQAEPWPPGKPLVEVSLDEQFRSMDFDRFQKNITFARATGFGEVYLWGAEWWYWMKTTQNHPEFWEEAKKLFEP
ncbi:hypothetical protein A3E96_03845 [Candidatus Uhrbacteria bacterium RIFCSPHIGHO2_12_FULL_46_13]|uniref:Glycoside hydrolase family 42 N-terminal domain-containing protein n=1 Tax=Candidatus Uhrbacteria bacterium RIFCSPLOWO2_01_FULL_47_25 TaxID=1802402 RepID=A0A1F7UXV5_9BACT|nr:MAG: hypothetical protein A2752_05000 [Candidatus Uhrbacteria bacterium RIFCSPHIGHO2_01_FULL_46_23]OGL68041.1 MAG: hypothetical protein A3D60_02805 [Candidatus Uhrbacteria bacterium RIFCSPHIGHO2_02_FULL_47_29]OGL76217.1 MAG: hypothetical protein A3E96_03845 [Candidatus Uhrbacteria bacterium RIFCSPHIGHO2_12_FULL_46_13]OGL82517.1 MAG: hypothetical protein A2936_03805 [Candidatus Uhrbacteria bacterium RIFCSPLOWO2_01_FULL_47_25]